MSTGALVTRVYGGFRGVDFRGDEVSLVRSPDSLNMWRDYKRTESIATRPGMALLAGFDAPVYGIYRYGERFAELLERCSYWLHYNGLCL